MLNLIPVPKRRMVKQRQKLIKLRNPRTNKNLKLSQRSMLLEMKRSQKKRQQK
jgi:hypothetical protein